MKDPKLYTVASKYCFFLVIGSSSKIAQFPSGSKPHLILNGTEKPEVNYHFNDLVSWRLNNHTNKPLIYSMHDNKKLTVVEGGKISELSNN